ncbi:MAG: DegT/DnrJ/EryC1/StrS family aminotransferase [Deltaproteobacteria bacterium]|nr:DegT/DnrJ/EryC1/StrS family aminotransferase [Deltaproteobacteria bacterium]
MTETIRLARPHFDEAEEQAALRVLRSGMLVLGAEVAAFERECLAALSAPDDTSAAAVNNGTTALELALMALGVGPGDEVIVPSVTWPSPGNAVILRGAVPVIVDVQRDTFNIDPKSVAAAITPKTRAIIAVDQFGVPADIAMLRRLAGDVPIVEDAACAMGSTREGVACGLAGDVGTFSFHPRKVLTTGEGGLVVSHRKPLMTRVRTLRNHGQLEPGLFREAGPNARMGELEAAIGRAQLSKLTEILAIRRALGERIRSEIALGWQQFPQGANVNYQTLGLVLPMPATGTRKQARDALVSALRAEHIEANILSYALHRLAPFASHAVNSARALPMAEAIVDGGLALPLHTRMTDADCDRIVAALRKHASWALGVRDWWQ